MKTIDLQGGYERVAIAETTRALLCIFAAGEPTRALPRVDADWDQVLKAIAHHGLVGLTYFFLSQQPASNYPPPEFRHSIEQAYRTQTIRMARLYQNMSRVLAKLTEQGMNYIVVKGPALAYTAYPDPAIRSFNDLDLIIRERDWNVMYCMLADLGFRQEENLPHPPPKFVPQFSIYETKYWHTKTNLLVEVHYEDLYNTGLVSLDIDGFWKRTSIIDVEGMSIRVPCLEDQLIHECMHAHYHGYTRLNWLSDLAFIVRDHAQQLDWKRVVEIARKEQVQTGVYYTLHFLNRLLNVDVSQSVLDALRPDQFRQWWHEHYLPQDQVLSLQPMRRPDFSFYFIPLFKRLIPDLLVMGRRREKIGCLVHLLIPPQAWLRHHYHVKNSRTLVFHYLLHPLKLAFHYLVEIGYVILGREPPDYPEQ